MTTNDFSNLSELFPLPDAAAESKNGWNPKSNSRFCLNDNFNGWNLQGPRMFRVEIPLMYLIGLRDNFNRKAPYFIWKNRWFPADFPWNQSPANHRQEIQSLIQKQLRSPFHTCQIVSFYFWDVNFLLSFVQIYMCMCVWYVWYV